MIKSKIVFMTPHGDSKIIENDTYSYVYQVIGSHPHINAFQLVSGYVLLYDAYGKEKKLDHNRVATLAAGFEIYGNIVLTDNKNLRWAPSGEINVS